MSAWPSLDRVDDERLAQALAAGDPGALPQIVDHYAARLFDYCHALLRDSGTASAALHDALLAAHAHVGRLREPVWFRGWLYSLVRNECLRRLRDPGRSPERREAPEVQDVFLHPEERAQRQETRRLVHGALSGLRGREREALDLMLRHGLDADELGGVLAVEAGEAAELAAAARRRLDDALSAAVIMRTGREDCPSVAGLVDGDGPLGPEDTRRVVRHIEGCPICADRCDRTVSTTRLLQVLPVALMPPELRNRILTDATSAEAEAMRAEAARRAEPFDDEGWPLPPDSAAEPEPARRSAPPRLWPAIAAAAAVILVVTGAFLLMPDSGTDRTSARSPSPAAPSSPVADPEDGPEDDPSTPAAPTTTISPTTPSATPTTPSATPSSRTPSRTPKPPASSRPPRGGGGKGTLSVGGCQIPTGGTWCPLSVRAVGGPVTWAVVGGSGVSASGGGRLPKGGTATVRATRTAECPVTSGSVSFAPGGSATVTWSCGEGDGGDPEPEPRP